MIGISLDFARAEAARVKRFEGRDNEQDRSRASTFARPKPSGAPKAPKAPKPPKPARQRITADWCWPSSASASASPISICSSSMSRCRTSAAISSGASLEDLSWVLNGYAIAYAALLVFFGRLAERYRRNLSFLLGVGLFTRGVGGLRRRRQCRDADRVSRPAGGRRGADDADVARAVAGGVPAGAPRLRGADLDGDRRTRRGAWAGGRRRAGDA